MKNKTFEYRGFAFEVSLAPNGYYHSINTKHISALTGFSKTEQNAIQMSKQKTDWLFEPTSSVFKLASKIQETASIPDYEEFEILPEVLAILLANYKPR